MLFETTCNARDACFYFYVNERWQKMRLFSYFYFFFLLFAARFALRLEGKEIKPSF